VKKSWLLTRARQTHNDDGASRGDEHAAAPHLLEALLERLEEAVNFCLDLSPGNPELRHFLSPFSPLYPEGWGIMRIRIRKSQPGAQLPINLTGAWLLSLLPLWER